MRSTFVLDENNFTHVELLRIKQVLPCTEYLLRIFERSETGFASLDDVCPNCLFSSFSFIIIVVHWWSGSIRSACVVHLWRRRQRIDRHKCSIILIRISTCTSFTPKLCMRTREASVIIPMVLYKYHYVHSTLGFNLILRTANLLQ